MKRSHGRKHKQRNAGQTKPETKDRPAIEEETGPTDLDSATSITQKSLELVEWRDANFQFADEEWDGDYIVATLGWTEEDGEWLKITSEVTPNGERAVTRVPLVNVVTRKPLLIVNLESTSITWPEHLA